MPLPFYSALIDTSTAVLLCVRKEAPITAFLAKAITEAEQIFNVNFPYYMERFPLATANPYTYPGLMWDMNIRKFLPTPEKVLTDELRYRSALAVKKANVLHEFIQTIIFGRHNVWSGLPMQESIYMAKRLQAQRYKDKRCPKDDFNYPYIRQFAELSGLTMRAAADEILFKAQLDDYVLAKSELIRMKYFRLLKDAKDIDGVEQVIARFRKGMYTNSI